MPARDIGSFKLRSPNARLGDPSGELDGLLELENLKKGPWLVLVQYVEEGPKEGELESFSVLHFDHLDDELDWRWIEQPVTSVSGLVGLFESERHEAFALPFEYVLLPHGFAHTLAAGPGRTDASVALRNDKVVGIEVLLNELE